MNYNNSQQFQLSNPFILEQNNDSAVGYIQQLLQQYGQYIKNGLKSEISQKKMELQSQRTKLITLKRELDDLEKNQNQFQTFAKDFMTVKCQQRENTTPI